MFEPDGILSAIGNTPLVPLKKIFASAPFRLYGKLEYLNPGGSAKDRPALYMIRRAMREGRIHSDTVLVESSSGNLAISLAQICSYLGLPLICVVDPKTTEQNIRIMKAFGARVERVEEPDPGHRGISRGAASAGAPAGRGVSGRLVAQSVRQSRKRAGPL